MDTILHCSAEQRIMSATVLSRLLYGREVSSTQHWCGTRSSLLRTWGLMGWWLVVTTGVQPGGNYCCPHNLWEEDFKYGWAICVERVRFIIFIGLIAGCITGVTSGCITAVPINCEKPQVLLLSQKQGISSLFSSWWLAYELGVSLGILLLSLKNRGRYF